MSSNIGALVVLHIYDVSTDDRVSRLNAQLLNLPGFAKGGIFHAAVEVYGLEYSYGQNDPGFTGVFSCAPKCCPEHSYRESHVMGETLRSEYDVKDMVKQMEKDWPGMAYDLLHRNCCNFADEFCVKLGVGHIPQWVQSLAVTGASIHHVAKQAKMFIATSADKLKETGGKINEKLAPITKTVTDIDEKYRLQEKANATAKSAGQKLAELDETYKVRETTGRLVEHGMTSLSGWWNRSFSSVSVPEGTKQQQHNNIAGTTSTGNQNTNMDPKNYSNQL